MIDIRLTDALLGLETLQDNSIDLVLTSPPYADIDQLNYGSIKRVSSNSFADWFIPIMTQINRVLKPSGSFILNINDFCKNGYKDPYIYKLIARSEESGLKLYDTYFWVKTNACPTGGPKRFRSCTEFIFHFVKDRTQLKFHMDRVLQEPCDTTKNKFASSDVPKEELKIKNIFRQESLTPDGKRNSLYKIKETPYMVRPTNVFNFRRGANLGENEIKHPAPFNRELPDFFIKFLTDEDDVVLDPFSGIGTTGVCCVKTNRNYIGFDLNEKYIEYSKERINKNITYDTKNITSN